MFVAFSCTLLFPGINWSVSLGYTTRGFEMVPGATNFAKLSEHPTQVYPTLCQMLSPVPRDKVWPICHRIICTRFETKHEVRRSQRSFHGHIFTFPYKVYLRLPISFSALKTIINLPNRHYHLTCPSWHRSPKFPDVILHKFFISL